MEIFIAICVILFLIHIIKKGKRKKILKDMIQNKFSQCKKYNDKSVSQMTEEEKYIEALVIYQNLLKMLSDNTLSDKVNAYFKTGDISEEDCEELAEKHALMVRLAALMNIDIDKLYDNFQNETSTYFLHHDKKKFIFNIVKNEINSSSAEKNAQDLSAVIIREIPDKNTARQFVLEELDAARQGSEEAQKFVRASGFKKSEYEGAMNNPAWEENEKIAALQIILRAISCQIDNEDMRCKVNLLVVDSVMRHWKLGKYKNKK